MLEVKRSAKRLAIVRVVVALVAVAGRLLTVAMLIAAQDTRGSMVDVVSQIRHREHILVAQDLENFLLRIVVADADLDSTFPRLDPTCVLALDAVRIAAALEMNVEAAFVLELDIEVAMED